MRAIRTSALGAVALVLPLPALAHHPMDGGAPATVADGVLSGLAHPVLGLDHLAFLLAAGLLAGAVRDRRAFAALPAFLVAGLLGAVLHLAGIGLGPVEVLVALSVLGAGVALLPREPRAPAWLALAFVAAGLVHGHALAGAVESSPGAVVAAYLVALGLVQGMIGALAILAGRRFAATPVRRLAGAGAASVGAIALLAAFAA